MALKDVNITVTDGAMSAGMTKGEGVHLKIGASPKTSATPIVIRGTYDAKRIRELLGLCPLADAAMDSVENGAQLIYCVPVTASTAGSVGAITSATANTGTGSLTAAGTPNNDFDVIVTIVDEGGLNAATFKYSINGGVTTSEEITVPTAGAYVLSNTGITITFSDGATGTAFKSGDKFTFTASAPTMTNSDITTAMANLSDLSLDYEFVHIVGETSEAAWAAISTAQVTLATTHHLPLMFVLEAYNMSSEADAAAYAAALLSSRTSVNNYDIQIVAARSNYLRMDGTTKNINMAGVICGLYAKSKPQQSIGETKSFSLSPDKVKALKPDGIEGQIQYLDEEGFLTIREYVGLDGYYVTNARMICPEGSDYKYAEHTRIKNKIIKKLRTESLGQMHSQINVADIDGSLQVLAKIIAAPLDDMVAAGEISSARIEIPEGQDILTTEKVSLKVRFTPKGYAREFEIDLGMERIA